MDGKEVQIGYASEITTTTGWKTRNRADRRLLKRCIVWEENA